MKLEVTVKSQDRIETVFCPAGANLLELLHQHGYGVYSPCGGRGRCGKCLVKVRGSAGELTGPEKAHLTQEQIGSGVRLACQVTVNSNFEVDLTPAGQLAILTEDAGAGPRVNPRIRQYRIQLEAPRIDQQQDYLHRIREQIGVEKITADALTQLGELEQKLDLLVTCSDNTILAFDAGAAAASVYGLAVDIGTTTVVLYLMDLANGTQLGVHAFANPQRRYGADVITRIDYAVNHEGGFRELQRILREALNDGIVTLAQQHCIDPARIYHAVFAGNTVMLHTLLGVNAAGIANAPYVPIFTDGLEFAARDLGLVIHPNGVVELLPCVAGYVGADITADLLAADFASDKWRLLVDIGTNGEIILGNNAQMLACSAAAGPAFEGANITFGMGGVPGAVAAYQIEADGAVSWQTIANQEPRGICGSGLVDIIAALYKRGVINLTGAFADASGLAQYQGLPAYRVIPGRDIYVTQKDVREYQLAAGAIAAGIKILISEAGIRETDIDRLYLAGGFGNYINPESAALLGLIPRSLLPKVVKLGNGAGAGAKHYLLDQDAKAKARQLRQRIRYIELSARPDFQQHFMEAMIFPEC